MKTLRAHLTDPKTPPLLYSELINLKYRGVSESDYLFFFAGRVDSIDKRSNIYKWRELYKSQGYKITGEHTILRKCLPDNITGYEHWSTAGVLCLSKEDKTK